MVIQLSKSRIVFLIYLTKLSICDLSALTGLPEKLSGIEESQGGAKILIQSDTATRCFTLTVG